MEKTTIIYLFHYSEGMPGVINKLQDKVLFLSQMGVDIKCLATYNGEKPSLEEKYAPLFIFKKVLLTDTKISIFENRFLAWINIRRKTNKNAKKLIKLCADHPADLYIRRMSWGNIGDYRFAKKYKGKIVWESNTLLDYEIKTVLKGYDGFLKSPIWKSYLILQHSKYSKKIASLSKAIIAVTDQIRDDHLSKSKCNAVVISNGIDVSKYPVCTTNQLDSEINFVMLLGTNAPWYGLDLLVEAIHKSNNKNFKVHIIGGVNVDSTDSRIMQKQKMTFYELNDYFDKLTNVVGIGSLALFRNKLSEASTLKVREYCARGLPVLLNHVDTDINNDLEFFNTYCVNLINQQLDFDQIIKAVKQIFLIPNYEQEIRKWAIDNLDHSIKMKQYLNVINES